MRLAVAVGGLGLEPEDVGRGRFPRDTVEREVRASRHREQRARAHAGQHLETRRERRVVLEGRLRRHALLSRVRLEQARRHVQDVDARVGRRRRVGDGLDLRPHVEVRRPPGDEPGADDDQRLRSGNPADRIDGRLEAVDGPPRLHFQLRHHLRRRRFNPPDARLQPRVHAGLGRPLLAGALPIDHLLPDRGVAAVDGQGLGERDVRAERLQGIGHAQDPAEGLADHGVVRRRRHRRARARVRHEPDAIGRLEPIEELPGALDRRAAGPRREAQLIDRQQQHAARRRGHCLFHLVRAEVAFEAQRLRGQRGRRGGSRRRRVVQERRGGHAARLAVNRELELLRREPGHGLAFAVDDIHVDRDEFDARLEGRRLLARRARRRFLPRRQAHTEGDHARQPCPRPHLGSLRQSPAT